MPLRAVKVGRIFQAFCIGPFVSQGSDEEIPPTHQEQAIVKSPNADPVVQNGCTIHVWKEKLAVMSIRLFPKLSEIIEKASSLVAMQLAKSQSMSMRLCQCLKLVIATSSSGLSASMLELPLFFPRASPDNLLSPPHSHWRAVADEPLVLYSRLSGDWPGEETSALLLPCDQEPCVARDYGGRVSLLDLAEMTLSGESGSAERETRKVRKVVQTRDQDGNIIYQWYDQDGHLHTISEWEYKRRLSMYFQSWLEFLYPEYFGSSIPAGGGWHQWQYWKVRRTADRPETPTRSNGQTGRHDTSPTGKRQVLLRLYSQYQRTGPPNTSSVIKAVGLSHPHQAGTSGKPIKMKLIIC